MSAPVIALKPFTKAEQHGIRDERYRLYANSPPPDRNSPRSPDCGSTIRRLGEDAYGSPGGRSGPMNDAHIWRLGWLIATVALLVILSWRQARKM